MKVGFTGTRHGMTEAQVRSLTKLLIGFQNTSKSMVAFNEFHHGDCIGSDAQAVGIARGLYWKAHSHPPDEGRRRAWTLADVLYNPRPYLDRNKDIVNLAEVVVATPREYEEVMRSGTWSTVRYAKFVGKKILIVFPNGDIETWESKEENQIDYVPDQ